MDTVDPPAGRGTLAEKLDHLFRTVRGPTGRLYSVEDAAAGIRVMGGAVMTASYLAQLRHGSRANPTKKHLEVLAKFFGVSPAYFFDDELAERAEADLHLAVVMRDAGVRDVALRAAGLSTESLRVVREIIERARELEGLP